VINHHADPEVETLTIRIPIRLQRRGGRKRIVAPDGSAIVPSSKPQPEGTLPEALARSTARPARRRIRIGKDDLYSARDAL
jgi:hypothetical protein